MAWSMNRQRIFKRNQLVIPYFIGKDVRDLEEHLFGVYRFASCTPKIGPWQEYKKGVETYGQWFSPPLRIADGTITVPKGPGLGLADPKEILQGATRVQETGTFLAPDTPG